MRIPSTKKAYQWTPARKALGSMIVVGGVIFAGFVAPKVYQALREWRETERLRAVLFERLNDEMKRGQFDLSNPTIELARIQHGGPTKDGIPALTDPRTDRIEQIPQARRSGDIIGVTLGGASRAYPVDVLMYHEVVNDIVGGVPIAVVYCPLCDSVSVVDRRLNDRIIEFGVSGLLVNSNVLLYDRGDDSLWSQLGFSAISGPNAGATLSHLPWTRTTAGDWARRHPDSTIVTRETGYSRNYDDQPYGDYFESDQLYFPVAHEDNRLGRKEPIVGVALGGARIIYRVSDIHAAQGGRVQDQIDGEAIVLAAAGIDGVQVVQAPDDARVMHTFWFAWIAFHPESAIYAPEGPGP